MHVTALRIKKAKGLPAETVPEFRLLSGFGIEGDAKAGAAGRQVCLISAPESEARESDGLCSRKLQANIETDAPPEGGWKIGARVRFGDAAIRIEQVGKECWPECEAFQRAGPCSLARGCVFAAVVADGGVRVGDEAAVE
jgi:MOSC domain-containing protein YiiM